MKFTCDSCGAQYMIGDEKLGQRGVKVRCKKCSYVIILRPAGYQPLKKAGEADAAAGRAAALRKEEPASERPITLPEEAFVPTTPLHQTAERRGQGNGLGDQPRTENFANEIAAATSSELGLSRDFAAMGFDDDGLQVPAHRSAALNLGIDVRKIESSFPDQSSPFQSRRIGGSLEDDQHEDDDDEDGSETLAQDGTPTTRISSSHPAAKGLADLGVSIPRIAHGSGDEPSEETSVDSRTPFARGAPPPPPADEDGETDDEQNRDTTSPSRRALAEQRAQGGSESTAPDEDVFDEKSDSNGAGAAPRPHGGEGRLPDFSDGRAIDQRLDALEKDELADMESSLERALATGGHESAAAAKAEPEPSSMAALGALAAAADDRASGSGSGDLSARASPAFTAAKTVGESHRSEVGPGLDSPMLDHEIGSAFDAMFGPQTSSSGVGAGLQQAGNEPTNAGALNGGYHDPELEKRPTRIFDIGAMQQVQAEQDMAGNGHRKPSIKEQPEWYVAISDEQVGPLSFDEVRVRWDSGDVNPSTLCWKQGMADWTPIRQTKELEGLGDMEANALTVVARIEKNDPEPEEQHEDAPTIAIAEGGEPGAQPRATSTKLEPPDEPSWRPSAASALASLAAAELASDVEKGKRDGANGRSLPATSDALEKLLAGDKKPGGSPFGSAEVSSSSIRPLPKRTEVVSSVSLRDPMTVRPRSSSIVPALIVGGCMLVGLMVVGIALIARGPSRDVTPTAIAPITTGTGGGAGSVAAQGAPAEAARRAGPAESAVAIPAPAQVAGQPPPAQPGAVDPATQQAQAAPPGGTAPPGQASAPPSAPSPPPTAAAAGGSPPAGGTVAAPSADPPKAAVAKAPPKDDASSDESKKTGFKPRKAKGSGGGKPGYASNEPKKGGLSRDPRESRESKDNKASAPTPAAATAIVPAPPAARLEEAKSASGDEELLGAAGKKRRVVAEESSAIPKQLEDSDILGVMRHHTEAIKACHQKQKSADPALEGVMTVNFVIEGNGKTKRWAVSPDKFKSALIGKCVIDAVKGWTFPAFSGRPMPVDFPVRVRGK